MTWRDVMCGDPRASTSGGARARLAGRRAGVTTEVSSSSISETARD